MSGGTRGHPDSGEARGGEDRRTAMEASLGSREEVGMVGRRGSERRGKLTEAAAAMAGGGRRTHTREEREARAEASLLRSEATGALRRRVR
jgi:hypothetical protein